MSKNRLYKNKFIIAFFAFAVLLCSGHAFQTVISRIEYLPIVVAGLLFPLVLASVNGKGLKIYNTSWLLLVLMVLLTFTANFFEGARSYILFICIVVGAYGISLAYSLEKLAAFYLKIMTVAAVVGILGYYIINRTALVHYLPVATNLNGIRYATLFFHTVIIDIPGRNCGMFWEPGLFATYLSFALVFEIIFKGKKANPFRIIIFSWAIITANSSAGFVLLVLALMLFFVKNSKRNGMFLEFVKFLVFISFIVLIFNYESILVSFGLDQNEYISKLLFENMSESTRVLAIEHNFETFMKSPAFGVGISEALSNSKHVADTSTSTYILSVYGVPGIMYTLFWAYAVFSEKRFNLYTKILLFVIVMAIVNKEPHLNLMFSWILMFSLIRRSNEDSLGDIIDKEEPDEPDEQDELAEAAESEEEKKGATA